MIVSVMARFMRPSTPSSHDERLGLCHDQPAARNPVSRRTSNLAQRIWRHREGITGGFTSQYGLHRLVSVEPHESITEAIRREKRLKNWPRAFKVRLIEAVNSAWEDLYLKLLV